MRINIKCRLLGSTMAFALVLSVGAGCGVSDDSSDISNGRVTQQNGAAAARADYITRGFDPLSPDSSVAGDLSGQAEFELVARACAPGEQCRTLVDLENWCGLPGGCDDRCDEQVEVANSDFGDDGCVCRPSQGGFEICDAVDNDCDGVVDNFYAGGHVSARSNLTCVTSRSGALRCMGDGQGVGSWPSSPVRLGQVSAGGDHGCALGADAQVYCWGGNQYGQALPGGPAYVGAPTRVELHADILRVGTGANHSCAMSEAGEIYCWGRNQYSQLGDGTSTPHDGAVEIAAALEFVDLSLGSNHGCAATRQGRVLCWGANHSGQAGQPYLDAINMPSWVEIPLRITQVSAGGLHTCALSEEGRVYCWGNNDHGQLGDGSTDSRRVAQVAGEEFIVASISAGGSRTCGLAENGKAYCWGDNALGSLGVDGDEALYLWPDNAAGNLYFSQISAGGAHTCGLGRSGHLLCWGRGRQGQLGGGPRSQTRQPRRVDCR